MNRVMSEARGVLSRLGRRVTGHVAVAAPILGVLALELYLVFVRQAGAPAAGHGLAAIATGEVIHGVSVSQTLVLEAGGFRRIRFRPIVEATDVGGEIAFELRDLTNGEPGRVVHRRVAPAAEVAAASSYALEFVPIDDSYGRRYRLDILAPGEATRQGIGFRAVPGRRYRNGALAVGGQLRWANLVFTTSATRATVFSRLVHRLREPFGALAPLVFVLGFVVANGAWLALVRVMVQRDQASDGATA